MNESISGGKMKHIKEIEGFVINNQDNQFEPELIFKNKITRP